MWSQHQTVKNQCGTTYRAYRAYAAHGTYGACSTYGSHGIFYNIFQIHL